MVFPIPCWRLEKGPVAVDFVRAEDGTPPRQPTRLTLTADARALHVRFDCVDRDPWTTFTRRDEPLWQQEVVEVFLAPGESDPRCYVELEVSPAGVLFDALVANPTGHRRDLVADTSWDCPGLAWAAGLKAGGWWVTLDIPWRNVLQALGEAGHPTVWRGNFYRVDRPRNGDAVEYSAASPTLATPADFHRPERFGCVGVPLHVPSPSIPLPQAGEGRPRPNT